MPQQGGVNRYNFRMRDLSTVRDGWDEVEAEETRLLREMTLEEGLRAFLSIQATLEHQYQLTDALFRPDREAGLIELQRRLERQADWKMSAIENLYRAVVKMQQRLDEAGVPSAIIGGIAISVWGTPRGTRDVDLKILLGRDSAQRLLDILGSDFRPMHRDPLGNLRGNAMIFVLDSDDIRLDLLLADVGFDAVAIGRAIEVELSLGIVGRVCTAEDLIIYKLISTREQDHIDAASVVRRQADALNHRYVLKWLRQFELALDDSTLVPEYKRLRAKYAS